MNKRTKKKMTQKVLATVVKVNTEQIGHLLRVTRDQGREINRLTQRLTDLERIQAQNTAATNNRFDQLEAENKALRIDLDRAILEFKKPKRSLFGRK